MDFVHEVDGAVVLSEFVFRVYENQATFGGDFRTALEEGEGVFFKECIFFGSCQTLCQDFFLRDVGIVLSDFCLGGRSDDGGGELLVLTHSFGQTNAADFAHTALVGTPGAAAEVAANNHFHGETLAHHADGDHGVGGCEFPVGADVLGSVQELCCNLVEHLALEGDAFRQYHVEGADAVGGYHHQTVAEVIYVTYLSVVHSLLSGEVEIGFRQRFHLVYVFFMRCCF